MDASTGGRANDNTMLRTATTTGRRWALAAAVGVLLLYGAPAAVFCVRAGASGNGSGADWTNAFTQLPNVLQRGSTYYVAQGNYPGYTFDDNAAGATTITVAKATLDDHGPATGWQGDYADGQAVFGPFLVRDPYFVIDGRTGGGPGQWDSGHGIRIQGTGGTEKLVQLIDDAHHVTVQHAELAHRGLDFSTPDDGIYSIAEGAFFSLRYCYLRDFSRAPILSRGETDWLVECNFIARNSSNVVQHSEAWSDIASTTMTVRHNIFADIEGTAFIAFLGTASDVVSGWNIYGNVFCYTAANPANRGGVGDGIIAVTKGTANDMKVYNNAFVNIDDTFQAGVIFLGGVNNRIHNNVWFRMGRQPDNDPVSIFTDGLSSNNAFFRLNGAVPPGDPGQVLGEEDPFIDWANLDFRLEPGSAAFNAGVDPGDGFDAIDAYGIERGARGGWDIGPYEIPPDTTPPTPPESLVGAFLGATAIELTWSAATDNLLVDHYLIYRNKQLLDTASGTAYLDDTLAEQGGYLYYVIAVDADGNQSSRSPSLHINTGPTAARVWMSYV
jgi:hypothetical protein